MKAFMIVKGRNKFLRKGAKAPEKRYTLKYKRIEPGQWVRVRRVAGLNCKFRLMSLNPTFRTYSNPVLVNKRKGNTTKDVKAISNTGGRRYFSPSTFVEVVEINYN